MSHNESYVLELLRPSPNLLYVAIFYSFFIIFFIFNYLMLFILLLFVHSLWQSFLCIRLSYLWNNIIVFRVIQLYIWFFCLIIYFLIIYLMEGKFISIAQGLTLYFCCFKYVFRLFYLNCLFLHYILNLPSRLCFIFIL